MSSALPYGRKRYLFVLSHMRSYSSLLAHVLGSSPEIDGYGETHTLYRHKLDLWRLRRRIRRSTSAPLRGRWLLDKILQNNVQPPDRMIRNDHVRAIITLRNPESAIRSIATMLADRIAEGAPTHDTEWGFEYYVSRLKRLISDGERLQERAIYFDAEALIERPKDILMKLSNWLELEMPLTTDYRVLQRTGEFGFGDPSQNIRTGRILGASASTIAQDTRIPGALLRRAEFAYRQCRASLLANCVVADQDSWNPSSRVSLPSGNMPRLAKP